MDADTIYAVIDLETTGTAVKTGDRIIQFGCALVQRGQVIKTVSQLINPDRSIPPTIQRLTSLTPDALVSAPYFEEFAPQVTALLADTVIVAHNVNFDYPFLSAELERVGQPALAGAGIDTVELAQILLPTMASYRLVDLTHALAITHDHPHRADSDAVSTAQLFLALTRQFQALPSQTQTQLVTIGGGLLRETGAYLATLVKPTRPLANDQRQSGVFVLKRPSAPAPSRLPLTAYPLTDKAKRQILRAPYRLRRSQAKMMDRLHDNLTGAQTPLFIEAGTGLGKTFGYLLPYLYQIDATHPLVISTPTTVLQTQLVTEAVPALRELVHAPLPTVLVKSPRHFISLDKLAVALHQTTPNRVTCILLMKLVVWLTQTTTGDLDELHLTNYRAPLFTRIRHDGQALPADSPYAEVDFWQRLQDSERQAAIIVTNHAYLARHDDTLVDHGEPYLVIDEAQHFADNLAEARRTQLRLGKLRGTAQQLRGLIDRTERRSLTEIFADDRAMRDQLTHLTNTASALQNGVESWQQHAYHHFFNHPDASKPGYVERALDGDGVAWLTGQLAGALTHWGQDLAALIARASRVLAEQDRTPDRFLAGDAVVFQALDGLTMSLREQAEELAAVDLAMLRSGQAGVTCLTLRNMSEVTSLAVTWSAFDVSDAAQRLLQRFTAPLFVGATLAVDRSFSFLAQQLGYPDLPAEQTLRLRGPFRYKDQAQLFVDSEAPNANQLGTTAYADYLAKAITLLASGEHQTIVLFTSLSMIAAVYHRLNRGPLANQKELLAQGVTGSAEKIAKRFAVSQNALLLGAASFFEGIDYPAKQLEMVILTRLPFDSPSQPVVAARYAHLTGAGIDPFAADALPRATLRLRQSFGRLIRTETDRGVFVVLDPRFTTTAFGRQMQHALPNLKPMQLPLQEINQYAETWLQTRTPQEKEGQHA